MPNDLLFDRVFALGTDATVTEGLILKLAAALLQQLDPGSYVVSEDGDPGTTFNREEFHSLPNRIELIYGIPRPINWEIPEHLAALERESRELDELTKQFNSDHTAAWNEFVHRMKERGGNSQRRASGLGGCALNTALRTAFHRCRRTSRKDYELRTAGRC